LSHDIQFTSEKLPPQLGMALMQQGFPPIITNAKLPVSDYGLGVILVSSAGGDALLRADVKGDGTLMMRVMYNKGVISPQFSIQMKPSPESDGAIEWQGSSDLEFKGGRWSLAGKILSSGDRLLNFVSGSVSAKITNCISVGAEAFQMPYKGLQGISGLVKYSDEKNSAYIQGGKTGPVQLGYIRKVSDRIRLGTELTLDRQSGHADCVAGYDYIFRQARLRGGVYSSGKVYQMIEQKMVPGVSVNVACEIDHTGKDHRFGFGLSLGEQ